jgi:hypothetical protein
LRPRRLGLVGAAVVAGLALGGATAPGGEGEGRRLGIGDGRGGFGLRRVASFDQPTYLEGPRGAHPLLYVVEREGRVEVLHTRSGAHGTFLDIRDRVSCCEVERGMFSIAFPDFRHSRRFYVYYTDNEGDLRIVEYRRRKGSRTHVSRKSARPVLQIRHRSAANHNGGQLQFGPEGLLYIGTGDGGTGGDPAQRKGSLLGKLLRIDPHRHGRHPYRSPRSNPFVGETGRNEIYARGLRNPWRFSFDRRHVAIGDVGQDQFEEIDYESLRHARRANFGWNVFEGTMRVGSGSISGHERPIHQYSHGAGRCAITGGYVSRDRRIRSLYGRYVYGDLCAGGLRSLVPRDRGGRRDRGLGVRRLPGLVSFGVDSRKRLYAVQRSGGIYRIVPR